jgi:tRNA(Ile)-lysidine synthase
MTKQKPQQSIEQRVSEYIRRHNLINPGEKLVVAVSGGADSVCLLYILSTLCKELGVELHVAHLNHQLRGAESDADAEYVAKLAQRLKIPVTVESRDIKKYQTKNRLSPEEAAREVRYSFLAEVAASVGAAKVAVGHTADDHVETILMHLLRGSGTRGLRGLLPLTRLPGLTIIRPLLEMTREETAAYCKKHRLHPHIDSSNLSMEPFRNKIRHQLLPQLREYNPQIAEALQRTARIAADDLAFIEGEANRRWGEMTHVEGNAVIIDKTMFLSLPSTLQRHLLRASIDSVLGDLKDIEAGHIEDIMEALEKPSGKVIGLPSGLNFTIEYDRYVLAPDSSTLCPLPPLEDEYQLKIPGKTVIPGWNIEASIIPPSTPPITDGDFTAEFDYAATGDKLTVRRRRPADCFQPLGMGRPKKLNRFMIDARIPRSWRPRVPVVSANEQIIWVAGWRIDERFKVTRSTEKALRLEFRHR